MSKYKECRSIKIAEVESGGKDAVSRRNGARQENNSPSSSKANNLGCCRRFRIIIVEVAVPSKLRLITRFSQRPTRSLEAHVRPISHDKSQSLGPGSGRRGGEAGNKRLEGVEAWRARKNSTVSHGWVRRRKDDVPRRPVKYPDVRLLVQW